MRYGKWVTESCLVASFSFRHKGASPLFIRKRRSKIRGHSSTQAPWPTIGPFSNMRTCDDIKKCLRLGSSATWHCSFCLFVWLIAQNTTRPKLASSQSSFLAIKKKNKTIAAWSTFMEAIPLLFKSSFQVSWESSFMTSPACNKDSVAANTAGSNSLRMPSCILLKRWETKRSMYPKPSCFIDYLMVSDWPWPLWLIGILVNKQSIVQWQNLHCSPNAWLIDPRLVPSGLHRRFIWRYLPPRKPMAGTSKWWLHSKESPLQGVHFGIIKST